MPEVIHKDSKPKPKQVYLICRLLCERAEVKFPENREQASQLIGKLKEAKNA